MGAVSPALSQVYRKCTCRVSKGCAAAWLHRTAAVSSAGWISFEFAHVIHFEQQSYSCAADVVCHLDCSTQTVLAYTLFSVWLDAKFLDTPPLKWVFVYLSIVHSLFCNHFISFSSPLPVHYTVYIKHHCLMALNMLHLQPSWPYLCSVNAIINGHIPVFCLQHIKWVLHPSVKVAMNSCTV